MSTQRCRPKAVASNQCRHHQPVRMATPIEMATEMETTTVAVPAVLAVRVEVRVPAARTAAPYTSLPRHLPSTAMCLCVQLQDSHEKPSKDDPKYMDQARNALLAKSASGWLVGVINKKVGHEQTRQAAVKPYASVQHGWSCV